MVSNLQNLNQVVFDEFLGPIQSLGVKKNDIIAEPLKLKYSNIAPYNTHHRHSTPLKYEDEINDDEEDVRHPSHIYKVNKDRKTLIPSLLENGMGNFHKPPVRKANILYVN